MAITGMMTSDPPGNGFFGELEGLPRNGSSAASEIQLRYDARRLAIEVTITMPFLRWES